MTTHQEAFNTRKYWEQRLSNNFDLQGVGFQGVGYEYNEWLYRYRAYVLKRLLKRYVSKGARILDVGTGTGFYVSLLRKAGYENIHALDFNSVTAMILQKEFPEVTFYNADITQSLSNDLAGSFDLVICIDVLFHIVNDELYQRAIKNLSKLAAPNGTIIISENLGLQRADRTHIVDRTEAEIRGVLQKNKVSVVNETEMFLFMNKPYKTKSKFFHWFSAQRVKLLRWNDRHSVGAVNYVIGMTLFCLEVAALFIGIGGKGTSLLVCKKHLDKGAPAL